MASSRFSILVAIFFVVVIGTAGYFFSEFKKVKPEVVWKNNSNELTLANPDVLDKFVADIPATKKPEKVNVTFNPDIPGNIDLLVAFSKDTKLGPNGYGVACGEPTFSQVNKQVYLTVYATVDKLKEKIGKSEAQKIVNQMLRKCIRRAVWSQSVSVELAASKSNDIFDSTAETVLVKLQ